MSRSFVLALKILLTIGLMGYIFTITPFADIWGALSRAYLPLVMLGLLFDPISLTLNAVNMKLLFSIQDAPIRIRNILRINFTTEFYGFFLPGMISSGVIRWHQFTKATGKPAAVLATIIFVRLWDTALTLGVGCIFWALDPVARQTTVTGWTLALLCAATMVTLCLAFNRTTCDWLRSRLKPCKLIPDIVITKLASVFESSARLGPGKNRALLYTLITVTLRQILGVATFACFAKALGIDIDFISLGWAFFLLNIVLMLPITFSGIGVREGSLIAVLGIYGIAPSNAVALSWLLFLNAFILRAIGGLLEGTHKLLAPQTTLDVAADKIEKAA